MVLSAEAAKCSRCHGKGTICVFPKVSEYGVNSPKKHCSICDQYVYPPHYEKCPSCGGSGGSSSSSKRTSRSRDDGESLQIYWTPQEYEAYKSCLGQLNQGVKTYIDCSICGGSGDCKYCVGYMNVSLDAPVSSICSYCGGSGVCAGCGGKGYSGTYYKKPTGEEKAQLERAIANLENIALERRAQRNGEASSTTVSVSNESDTWEGDSVERGDSSSTDDDSDDFWDDFEAILGLMFLVVLIIVIIKNRND